MSFSPHDIEMKEREEEANRRRHEGRFDEWRRVKDRLLYWAKIYEGNGQPDVAEAFRDLAKQEFTT